VSSIDSDDVDRVVQDLMARDEADTVVARVGLHPAGDVIVAVVDHGTDREQVCIVDGDGEPVDPADGRCWWATMTIVPAIRESIAEDEAEQAEEASANA
jgi:hypothetical protein